jgi:hypothetical protein
LKRFMLPGRLGQDHLRTHRRIRASGVGASTLKYRLPGWDSYEKTSPTE